MDKYFHSVRLLDERCKGCVSCTKHCPTEAIRIRGGKAFIKELWCIDCGECIRRCPNHAKSAVTDSLEDLAQYRYNVALIAPSLYGQFEETVSVEAILESFRQIGFDKVAEVARGAEIAMWALKEYLERPDIKKPLISSACPTVVRLIQVKFPELIDHLAPIDPPIEIAARMARDEVTRETNFKDSEVGIWFITPCPAKMTAIREPLGAKKTYVTGAIAMSKIYGELLKKLPKNRVEETGRKAGPLGVGWALAGGETAGLAGYEVLVVHEIHNVSEALEQITLGTLDGIDYVEFLACDGGCIGGPLTVSNRYVAENRLKHRMKKMKKVDAGSLRSQLTETDVEEAERSAHDDWLIDPRPVMKLDEDIVKAIHKVELIDETLKRLPGLDCGSCGSPTCRALAEDIVQGQASETDCTFRLREMVRDLAQEMVNLAEKLPPSLNKQDGGEKNGGLKRDDSGTS